ncbi:MAG: hypothetical protein JW712_00310 [Dehalococcoidales bacterium]|nr:hypothetical protein [Dehalococcoidales bacterium]
MLPIDEFPEDQVQALIILIELESPIDTPNNNFYKPFPKNAGEARTYFRRFSCETKDTLPGLEKQGLARKTGESWELTVEGKEIAGEIRKARPPIYYWYRDFYSSIENSRAFDEYSRRVFGRNRISTVSAIWHKLTSCWIHYTWNPV